MTKYLFLIVALFFGGCTNYYDTPIEEDDMVALGNPVAQRAQPARLLPHQWGQSTTLSSPWKRGEIRPIVTLDRIPGRIPVAKTAILSLEKVTNNVEPVAFYNFRWVVYVGVGGGNTTFVFDASRATQIALPAETLRVELRCDPVGGSFSTPLNDYAASVFFADYPTSTEPPIYSERYVIANGAPTEQIVPPRGATGVRIYAGHTDLALTATTTYFLVTSGGAIINSWLGSELAPLANRLPIITVPGVTNRLLVGNAGASPIDFWTLWSLDL